MTAILLKWSKSSGLEVAQTSLLEVDAHAGPNDVGRRDPASVHSAPPVKEANPSLPTTFRSSVYGGQLLDSVYGLFSQVYPILLATTASIGRNNLTLFESHFAVAVSASPVSVYLAWMAFHDAFHTPAMLRHVMKNTKNAVALWLGLLLPCLWLTLNLVVSFRSNAFTNSYLCKGMNIPRWFEFQLVSNFVGVLDVMGRRDLWSDLHGRGGLGAVSVVALWVWGIYFVHHRDDIVEALRKASKMYDGLPRWRRWPLRLWEIIKAPWYVIKAPLSPLSYGMKLSRDVIARRRPWLVLVIICCFHWSWILGILRGISLDNYQFSYGQVLFFDIRRRNMLTRYYAGLVGLFCYSPHSSYTQACNRAAW